MISEDKLQEISRKLNEVLKRSLREIEIDPQDIRALIAEAAPPEPAAAVETRGSAELLGNLAEIDEGASQLEILERLVGLVGARARGSAVVIVGDPISTVWPGTGLGLEPGQQLGAKKISLPLPEGSVVKRAAKEAAVIAALYSGSPDDAALYNALGQEAPGGIAAIPMAIRGKIQAVVLADAAAGFVPDVEALAILVRYAGMAIELLPSREKVGHVRIPMPAGTIVAEAAPAPPVEFEIAAKSEAAAPEIEVVEEPEAAAPEIEVVEEMEAAEESPPVEVAEPAIPELGLEGYELAALGEEERLLHEKAIRFARLLVSEIKLYNEEAVSEGRQNADLMIRLKDEIDKSRSLYDERIAAETREAADYFREELVRQLADGDTSLLGEE